MSPWAETHRFSPWFDYLLRGESEEAFLLLLKTLESDRPEGTAALNASLGNLHLCDRFDNIPDLSLVVGYDETVKGSLFKHLPWIWTLKNKMLPMLMFQGTRGCPYNCSFCPTSRFSRGKGYRRRSLESAVAYLEEHREEVRHPQGDVRGPDGSPSLRQEVSYVFRGSRRKLDTDQGDASREE